MYIKHKGRISVFLFVYADALGSAAVENVVFCARAGGLWWNEPCPQAAARLAAPHPRELTAHAPREGAWLVGKLGSVLPASKGSSSQPSVSASRGLRLSAQGPVPMLVAQRTQACARPNSLCR